MRREMALLSLALTALALQGSVIPKPSQEPVVAFVDVHVIPMSQAGVLDHQDSLREPDVIARAIIT